MDFKNVGCIIKRTVFSLKKERKSETCQYELHGYFASYIKTNTVRYPLYERSKVVKFIQTVKSQLPEPGSKKHRGAV